MKNRRRRIYTQSAWALLWLALTEQMEDYKMATSKEAIEIMQSKIDNDELTLKDIAESYIRAMKGFVQYEASVVENHAAISASLNSLMQHMMKFTGIWIFTGSMEDATELRECTSDFDFPDTIDGRMDFVKELFSGFAAWEGK